MHPLNFEKFLEINDVYSFLTSLLLSRYHCVVGDFLIMIGKNPSKNPKWDVLGVHIWIYNGPGLIKKPKDLGA